MNQPNTWRLFFYHGLLLLFLAFFEGFFLGGLAFRGLPLPTPLLLPLGVLLLGFFLGDYLGAGLGLWAGVLMLVLNPAAGGFLPFFLALLGFLAGVLPARFGLPRDLSGAFFMVLGGLLLLFLLKLPGALARGEGGALSLALIAGREGFITLLFLPPAYFLCRFWVAKWGGGLFLRRAYP